MKPSKIKKDEKSGVKEKKKEEKKKEPYWFKRNKAKFGSSSFLDGTSIRDIIEAEADFEPLGMQKASNSVMQFPTK